MIKTAPDDFANESNSDYQILLLLLYVAGVKISMEELGEIDAKNLPGWDQDKVHAVKMRIDGINSDVSVFHRDSDDHPMSPSYGEFKVHYGSKEYYEKHKFSLDKIMDLDTFDFMDARVEDVFRGKPYMSDVYTFMKAQFQQNDLIASLGNTIHKAIMDRVAEKERDGFKGLMDHYQDSLMYKYLSIAARPGDERSFSMQELIDRIEEESEDSIDEAGVGFIYCSRTILEILAGVWDENSKDDDDDHWL